MNRWPIAAVALGSPVAAAALYYIEPTENSWYPRCYLNALTGLHCPFCGATRCSHALLHGDFAQAAAWNVLTVVLLPLAALWLAWAVLRVVRGKPVPTATPPNWLLRAFLVFLIVFSVARNLPFYPFDLLAPHKL